jgi:hypothetical protein
MKPILDPEYRMLKKNLKIPSACSVLSGIKLAVFGILLLLAAGIDVWAQPRIVFDEGTIFDFGVLIQGATTQHTIAFRNAGNETLELQSVTTSCGCTAALPDDKLIPPGRKSQMWVGYDSHGKMGEVHKVVRVRTNDPANPVVHLVVRGLVVPSKHPEMTGPQNLFAGSCKTCHVDAGMGKTGAELYRADCAMCHEHHKMGGHFLAPSAEDMAARSPRELRKAIAEGREGTSMPAFHQARGGPLTDKEIKSLVRYIRGLKKE